jgi:hypothetical protein
VTNEGQVVTNEGERRRERLRHGKHTGPHPTLHPIITSRDAEPRQLTCATLLRGCIDGGRWGKPRVYAIPRVSYIPVLVTVRYVPVPVTGTVYAGTGTV